MYALLCIVSTGFCNTSALTGFCNTSVRAVSIIAMFTGKRCSGAWVGDGGGKKVSHVTVLGLGGRMWERKKHVDPRFGLVLLTFHVGHCEYQEEVYIHIYICIYIYINIYT
jgi:hypothetical protein